MDSSDLWDAWQDFTQKYLTCSFQRSCSDADKGFRDCRGTLARRTCVPANALGREGIPLGADEKHFERMQSTIPLGAYEKHFEIMQSTTHSGFPVPVMSS